MEFFVLIIILIMSVVIHEISHGYAALALGDPTAKYQNRLTLNPLNHLDPVGSVLVPLLGYFTGGFIIGWAKPVPFNPFNLRNQRWGEALVAAAGPISNILLAVIFSILIRIGLAQGFANTSFYNLAGFIVLINLTLAIFNLLPIPPLDGSKIIFAFLNNRFYRLRNFLEQYGIILVFLMVFIFWNLISPVIKYTFTFLVGNSF